MDKTPFRSFWRGFTACPVKDQLKWLTVCNNCDTSIEYIQDHYFHYDAKRATDALSTGRGPLKGATGCEIHTFTIHENQTHSPNFSTSSTAAILISFRDMRCTIIVWSRSATGVEAISKTYFLSASLKWLKTASNTAKSRRPSDLLKMNSVFLSVDPDFSPLAVKDLRPDQHWFPIADGNPIPLDWITRSFWATIGDSSASRRE